MPANTATNNAHDNKSNVAFGVGVCNNTPGTMADGAGLSGDGRTSQVIGSIFADRAP